MLKKKDAVPGAQIVFNETIKDVGGTVRPHFVLFPTPNGYDMGSGCYGINADITAEVLAAPKKKGSTNSIHLRATDPAGNTVDGYAFWCDVYKNARLAV